MNPKNNKNAIVQAVEEARRRQAAIQALLKMNQSTQVAANATPSQSKDLLSVYRDMLKPVADLGKSAGQFTLDTFGKAVKPVADLGASAWESASDALKINMGQDSWVRDFIYPKLFDDGYDFGDVSRSILGTVADAGADFVAGIGEGVEGIIDGMAFGGMKILDYGGAKYIFRLEDAILNQITGSNKFHTEDEWDETKKEVVDFVKGDFFPTDQFQEEAKQVLGYDWEQESILGEHADNLVQSVPPLIANYYASAHGFPSWIIPGFNAFGGKAEQALNEGATDDEAFINALITALAEVATERISGAILPGGGTSGTDILSKTFSKITGKALPKTAKLLLGVAGEGVEEMLAEDASTIADWLTHKSDQDLIEMLTSDEAWKNRLYAGLGGMILGGGSEAINIKKSGKSGRDAVTGLTSNEETVVQAETERRAAEYKADGKKANIGKIRDEVIRDMERGEISIDAIEKALGGESYSEYESLLKQENAIREEQSGLSDKITELLAKDQRTAEEQAELDKAIGDLSAVHERIKALNIDGAKKNLSTTVDAVTKAQGDSYLRESYNEMAKKSEDFQIDPKKYKSKKHQAAVDKTVQSALRAGLNNTRRVHEIVDMAAKISADTGLVFDLSNNQRVTDDFVKRQTAEIEKLESIPASKRTQVQNKSLQEMKEMLEKVKRGDITVNGTNSGNMITLNLDSSKPLNRLAGHEISHGMEKAKSYEALRDSLFAYAKSKGVDIDKKLSEYQNEYRGVKDADPEREMVADMVGDYLFSDEDFVKHLTKNRNLFQRVYDEIKYLLKLATTGSKEARELERVKHLFDKAYKQMGNANADTGTQYSFSSMSHTFFGNEDMSTLDWKKADYKSTEGYQAYVDKCVNNIRQSRPDFDEQAARQEVERSIDGIVRVAIAAKEAGFDILDSGKTRDVKDSKNRLLFSSLEPNSDYFTSSDISTICDKRKNFAEIYDDIVRAEEKMGVPNDKRFFANVDNYFYIHKLMAEKGLTTPCEECYVESMRKNLAPMANAFLKLVNETDPNNTANDQLYHQDGKDKGKKKKGNADTRNFVLAALEEYGMSPSDIKVKTITTADGLAWLKITAPKVYEAFNSFYGQSKPKMPKAATPFRFGELTALLTDKHGKIKQSLVNRINHTGGFRLQSYSDFQIQNFTDVLQVLFEAGTLGLNGHAYTKVPAFLEATEGTNLKRNISIFMYKDGDQWKLDRNDSFPYTLEEIYKLVDADKSGNTGIIAVSQNAEMSAWIMANDHIGYGIPYHKSGQKMDVVRDTTVTTEDGRRVKGYAETKDHTRQQTEVLADSETKVKKGIDIYSFWDFDNQAGLSKTQLIEKNVRRYIEECEKRGYLPKFREYVLDNSKVLSDVLRYSKELGFAPQDATIDDISFRHEVRDANGKLVRTYRVPYGYYKFLGDFGMFTPDGKASPQKTLSLEDYDFDKAVDFFADAETLRRNEILQQFANGELREQYRNSDLTTEELEQLAKRKRDEVVREVVGDDIAPLSYSLSENTAEAAGNAPVFYSRMAKVVDGMKQEKFGASSVISMLRGRGVKAEEIKWSGIETWLDGKKSVTKAELQEFIAGSMLQIDGEVSDTTTFVDENGFRYTESEFKARAYSLADEEGYDREDVTFVDFGEDGIVAYVGRIEEENELLSAESVESSGRWGQYKLDGGENYREILFKMPGSEYTNPAMRVHWGDAKGVLAHARVQDFDVNGKKMLFVEEIQSDWHNAGQKHGYFSDGDTVPANKAPDAPFKKNYHEYVMKRLIRMAAEEGYDSIGWTTADIQSDRWSYEYAESYRIEYDQNIRKFLEGYGKQWGAEVGKTEITTGELDEWVVDMIERGIIEAVEPPQTTVWSMDITPSMKESVLTEGQEMYSLSDSTAPLAPVNNFDTFGKDLKRDGYSSDIAPVKAETRQNIAPVQYSMTENGGQKPVTDHIQDDINKRLADLRSSFEPRIKKAKEAVADKKETIKTLAWNMLAELQTMEKGKRVSWDLGYVLDKTISDPEDYRSLEIALKNIRDNPFDVVNPRSKAERVARDFFERQFREAEGYASELERDLQAGIAAIANDGNARLSMANAPLAPTKVENNQVAPENTDEEVEKIPSIEKVMADDGPRRKQKSGIVMKLRNNLVDKGSVVDDIAIKTGNREIMGRYKAIGNAAAKAQHLIGKGNAKAGVKSLTEIQSAVKNVATEAEFDDYMYNRLNVDRMTMTVRYPGRHDFPVFGPEYSASHSRATVQAYEAKYPEFRDLSNDVYTFVRYNLTRMIREGMVSAETANLWNEMYPHYIPIERASIDDTVTHNEGRTGAFDPIKGLKGSKRKLRPMFTAIADQTIAVEKAIAKNRFGKELRKVMGMDTRTTGANGPVSGILDEGTVVYTDARGNGKVVRYDEANGQYLVQFKFDNGRSEDVWLKPEELKQMAPDTAMDEAIRGFFNDSDLLKPPKGEENPVFTIFEGGKRIEFDITPDMYDALKPTSAAMAKAIPVLSQVTNARKRILTDLNPVFWLTNHPKDFQAILVNSQHPALTYKEMGNAWWNIIRKGHWYQEYIENGGKQQSYFSEEERKLTPQESKAKRVLTGPAKFIRGLNEMLEMGPRLAEYIASRKKDASIDVAMLDAARVTTDFSAAGDVSRSINRNAVPFLTASISGASQQVRNIREAFAKGKRGVVGYIMRQAVALIPHILFNHILWRDDEEYEELQDYVKQNYYIVGKTDDGKFIRVPKGREVAVTQDFFELAANAITGFVTGDFDDVDVASFFKLMMNNVAPSNPIDNNILAPIIQAVNNETWYGEPIVSSNLQRLPDEEQFDESTDAISKWIGEMTGLSPARINYILDQYSGGFGDVLLPMLTPEAESGTDSLAGKLIAPIADKYTVDSTMKNQYVSDFYDKVDELEINSNSQNATDEDALMYAYMSSKNSEIGTLYGLKRKVNSAVTVGDLQDIAEELKPFLDSSSDPGLWYALNYGNQNAKVTDSSKYQIVRAIQRRIDDRAKKALETYESVSLDGGYATIGSDHFVKKEDSWKKLSTDEYNEQKLMTKAMGIRPDTYWNAKWTLSGFRNDKDENGDTIDGTRKQKITDWINSQDIPYEAKIMLYKSMYTGYRGYDTEIIQYLRTNPDISYEQMVEILEKLGFKIN